MKKLLVLGVIGSFLFGLSSCNKECTCRVTYDGEFVSTYTFITYSSVCRASDYEYYDYYADEGYSIKCK